MSTSTYTLSVSDPDDIEIVFEEFEDKESAELEMERIIQQSAEGTSLAITYDGNLVSTMFIHGEAQ